MPDIIRIRNLVSETNLDDIVFSVDKQTYLDDAHQIGIDDLKEWILSGYTGGGGGTGTTSGTSGIDGVDGTSGITPILEIPSNAIIVIVDTCALVGNIDCDYTG